MLYFSFWLILVICIYDTNSYKVSFFGDSHISMPIQEAKVSTNVRLKFKTSQENGLLFATAGRLDSCFLALHSGRLKLSISISNHHVELMSPEDLYLNDKQWHDVTVTRHETNITFQIDEHFIKQFIPSEVGDLNIHFGVHFGGLGDFPSPTVTVNEYFRGCMSDIYYNSISILKRAKENLAHMVVNHISWTCSDEFDADENESVSFLEKYSFIQTKQEIFTTTENYWFLEFKTINMEAPLFISYDRYRLLVAEIVDSKIKLLVESDNKKFQSITQMNVSDGHWHSLGIKQGSNVFEYIVDDTTSNITLDEAIKSYSPTFMNLYIGGLPHEKRRKGLFDRGVSTYNTSLQGCVRNIKVNGKTIGFPQFKVTNHIKPDCKWEYPCFEKTPCILSSKCIQQQTSKFSCDCDQLYCLRADYRDPYSIFSPFYFAEELEILRISPVLLAEGETTYITENNIGIPVEDDVYKINEEELYFQIVVLPKYGTLINIDGTSHHKRGLQNFTYDDVVGAKLKYTHDGSENHFDQMVVDVIPFLEKPGTISKGLNVAHRFILHFNITPVNDPPKLSVVKNTILKLVENMPEVLTTDYLYIEDSDTSSENLVYKVISTKHKEVNGNFEVNGKVANTFSHLDLLENKVTYVVRETLQEDKRFEVFLEVSDGIKTSPIISLPAYVTPLQLRLINNSGIVMIHGTSKVISHFNLSFSTNSRNHSFDIKYNIIFPPLWGNIEKQRLIDNSWTQVSSFTNNQLVLGQIRYHHLHGTPPQDEFKFTVSLGTVVTQIYDFRVKFSQFNILPVTSQALDIKGLKISQINSSTIYYQTEPQSTPSEEIYFTLLSAPKYGNIILTSPLKEGDNFTQADLEQNRVLFILHYTTYSDFHDEIQYYVSAAKCEGYNGTLKINYSAKENIRAKLLTYTQEKIHVTEGGRSTFSRVNFPISFINFPFLFFNVTEPPRHGQLCRYTTDFRTKHITSFTLGGLHSGEIQFCHDDSESASDEFKILIYSTDDVDFQYIASFQVDIKLKNDNEPRLEANKTTMYVVQNNAKIISKEILSYIDDDIDTAPGDIQYKNVVSNNGVVYLLDREAYEFTQENINNDLVYFQHNGALSNRGNITFTVTDGLHEVRGSLEVIADKPFIKLKESTDIIMKEYSSIVIAEDIIHLEINFDIDPTIIKYEVSLKAPKFIPQPTKHEINEIYSVNFVILYETT